jgi:hypothetical protein
VSFINTEDENSIHMYLQWMKLGFLVKSQRAKKFQKSENMLILDLKHFSSRKSVGKVFASVFWDKDGVIFKDYMQQGKSITGDCYCSLLRKL